ncbi:MAG: hypothetical protein AAGD38_01075 [Acidobacteriota bacterium]
MKLDDLQLDFSDPRDRHFIGSELHHLLDRYMDQVEDMLMEHPARARHWADRLPAWLVASRDPAHEARALGLRAATLSATGSFEEAADLIDQALAVTPIPADLEAWLLGVKANLRIHEAAFEQAAAVIDLGLEVVDQAFRLKERHKNREPHKYALEAVKAALFLARARLLGESGRLQEAIPWCHEAFVLAPRTYPRGGRYFRGDNVRAAALTNLVSLVARVRPKDAIYQLSVLEDLNIRARRPRQGMVTRADLITAWVVGDLQARLGSTRLATTNLAWACEGLRAMGAQLDALNCALDLIAWEHDHEVAAAVVRDAVDDESISTGLRRAASAWLASPLTAETRLLREAMTSEYQRRRAK